MSKRMRTSELKSFFYGMMLGDACVHRNGKEFSVRQIEKGLVDYKLGVIKDHLPDARIITPEQDAHHDGKWNHRRIYQFRIRSEYTRKLYDTFYRDGKKRVTREILEALKPNGMAVWFADDGATNLIGKENLLAGKKDRLTDRRLELCTDGFLLEDAELIRTFLDERYGPDSVCLVNRDYRDKGNANPSGYRIRFRVRAAQALIAEVKSDFLNYPDLLYKLDLGYRERDFAAPSCSASEEYREIFREISAHDRFVDRLACRSKRS